MKSKVTVAKIIIPAFFLLIFFLVYFNLSSKSDIIIRFQDDQIDMQKFTNAIAEIIIEQGYGYQVEKVESTIKEVHDHLITGDIDVTLEMWKENNLAWYDKALVRGEIEDLGVIYTGGSQYWIIPKWYAKKNNIKTVTDMQKHWRDFADPEDPSKGLFFNCIFGWTCRNINRIKLEAYGLDRFFNAVSPTSPDALEAIYEGARDRKTPVFGYYWEPNSIMTGNDWFILKEPPHSDAVWSRIIESATNPGLPPVREACAFKSSAVHKIANGKLKKKAPDVVDMLKKMKFDIYLFNDIFFQKDKNYSQNNFFHSKALFFLKQYPEKWHGWVTPVAQKKIDQALKTAHFSDVPGSAVQTPGGRK